MLDVHKAIKEFETFGKKLEVKQYRQGSNVGNFIKSTMLACRSQDISYIVLDSEVILDVYESLFGARYHDCGSAVLFTPMGRVLIEAPQTDITWAARVLSKVSVDDTRCCVCLEVPSISAHCTKCSAPLCATCFMNIGFTEFTKVSDDDEDEFSTDDLQLPCPTCRAPVPMYTWASKACFPAFTRSYPDFQTAIKKVITKGPSPFTFGAALRSVESAEEIGGFWLDDEDIHMQDLGFMWVENEGVYRTITVDGTAHDHIFEAVPSCAAIVLGRLPTNASQFIKFKDSKPEGKVLIKLAGMVHDASDAFPFYATYVALRKMKERELDDIFKQDRENTRIHEAVTRARKRWEEEKKKELEEQAALHEASMLQERSKFAQTVTQLMQRGMRTMSIFDVQYQEKCVELARVELEKLQLLQKLPDLCKLELARFNAQNSDDP